jgi:hypothetical protein
MEDGNGKRDQIPDGVAAKAHMWLILLWQCEAATAILLGVASADFCDIQTVIVTVILL